jgi:hypothetical protein
MKDKNFILLQFTYNIEVIWKFIFYNFQVRLWVKYFFFSHQAIFHKTVYLLCNFIAASKNQSSCKIHSKFELFWRLLLLIIDEKTPFAGVQNAFTTYWTCYFVMRNKGFCFLVMTTFGETKTCYELVWGNRKWTLSRKKNLLWTFFSQKVGCAFWTPCLSNTASAKLKKDKEISLKSQLCLKYETHCFFLP